MAGATSYAIRRIKSRISRRVLEIGLRQYTPHFKRNAGLNELIRSNILINQVYKDISVLSNIEKSIPIDKGIVTEIGDEGFEYILEFGEDVLEKEIVNVKSVSGPNHMATRFNRPIGNLANNVSKLLPDEMPLQVECDVDIIGRNIFLIRMEEGQFPYSGFLNCNLSSGETFSHIPPRYHEEFSKLCLFCCRAIIYNNLNEELDDGYIEGGFNINKIRESVESYADAEDRYSELLEEWSKYEFLFSSKQNEALIRGQIAG